MALFVSVENEAASAFIKTLASCNESQMDDKLIKNVEMSTTALTRIMQTYDHILHKYDEAVTALKSVPVDNSAGNKISFRFRPNFHDNDGMTNLEIINGEKIISTRRKQL